ncbi:MAG: translation initiation factor, partial [Verrucomicrobiales bacterium]|nr:translation initiation factor [Verrucomicrobiales bacterium]
KEVLAKAKELGITAAKVPSSSLDKITAEYLEEQFGAPKVVAPAPVAAEPIIVIKAPPAPIEVPLEPPATVEEPAEPAFTPADLEAHTHTHEPVTPAVVASEPEPHVEQAPEPVKSGVLEPVAENLPPAASTPPPAPQPPVVSPVAPVPAAMPPTTPAPPQLGDKVGFIKLPQKPGPRVGDKVGTVKLPARPAGRPPEPQRGGRPDFRGGQQQQFNRGPGQGQNRFQQGNRPGGDRRQESGPATPQTPKFVPPESGELICLKPPIIVRDLAEQLKKKPFQLIADLMALNVFANVNQSIDETVAQRLCAKYGFRFEVEKRERGGGVVHAPQKKVELDQDDKIEDLTLRAPVVTIMGHVDHGKTTLLDVIRKANVAAGEAGGITQHIGAYTITIPHPERPKDLQQITFLDTPGHAAFSSMRARGANVTDIVILVVAANDGVMPQTLEALSHAQAAKVPIIVAVNKIDHPNANPMKVRQQLQDKGVVPEEWGGETIFQDVSALTKVGVDKLLELILLQAEIMELKANPNRRAKGNVIESGLEPGGPTATVLVRKGTLRVGDTVICGQFYGKVRALINEEGNRLKEAGPSVAVRLLGLNGVPQAGIEFSSVENEKNARILAEQRGFEARIEDNERRPKVTLENLFDTLASDAAKTLRIVVKADTQGSVEAIVDALKKIDATKVSLEVIHSAVGTITESDVALASASKAIILGFHTRIDNGVSDAAKREGVQIKLYAIIYELIDQVKEAMAGLLDPLTREVVIGSAEVRKIFELSKGGNVAGCVVSSGRIVKGKMRVMRRKGLIYEGVSLSLRRFQDEVNEVRAGMECGIRLDGFNEFQLGDAIECYTTEKFAQKL